MNNKEALNRIYNDLNRGVRYGRPMLNVRWPYFDKVLYRYTATTGVSRGKDYFGWSHYGSSASEPTKKNLAWIIKVIFEMTPLEFLDKFMPESKGNALLEAHEKEQAELDAEMTRIIEEA